MAQNTATSFLPSHSTSNITHNAGSTHAPPPTASTAVLKPSEPLPNSTPIRGIDFNNHITTSSPITVDDLLSSYASTGFQASSLANAIRIINDEMINWQPPPASPEPSATPAAPSFNANPAKRRTSILLSYTSNLISSGLREILRYLTQHAHISAIITTAGGLEEDLIKCLAPTYLGSFTLPGADLRAKGLNRVGDLLVPNDNYCKFEDWVVPILDRMLDEQEGKRAEAMAHNMRIRDGNDFVPPFAWTPSAVAARLGKELDRDDSVLTWAYRNDIPVFCPALTDGSLGDMLYFHSYRASPRQLTIDVVQDIRKLNDVALKAERVGMIVLGGGVVKHHAANACLMRDGAEAAVFVNTGQEFDGSDAGARPDEAVSWGKIKSAVPNEHDSDGGKTKVGHSVKVHADATIVFPLIVAATFAKADRLRHMNEEKAQGEHRDANEQSEPPVEQHKQETQRQTSQQAEGVPKHAHNTPPVQSREEIDARNEENRRRLREHWRKIEEANES